MKETALKQLVVGMTATMKLGSPVRLWMRRIRDASRRLTPVHYYTLLSDDVWERGSRPQYVEVKIAKVMLPYAIVYHHNGQRWVRLWIDTRDVPLYSPSQ